MLKRMILSFMTLFLTAIMIQTPGASAAADNNSVTIQILSPSQVKDYPGFETTITAKITNHTNHPLTNAMTYITMADLGKHWTVNLEDYSADKPLRLKSLAPGESINVSLPIRFVYTSQYKLYVTVSSDTDMAIYSSNAIPVHILGNTKIDPIYVTTVSIAEPLIMLLLLGFVLLREKNRTVS